MLNKAVEAANHGRFAEALTYIAAEAEQPQPSKKILEHCFAYAWNASNFTAALAYTMRIGELYGSSPHVMGNTLACLVKLKKKDEATALGLAMLNDAATLDKNSIHNALCSIAEQTGSYAAAAYHGKMALTSLAASIPEKPKPVLPARKKFNSCAPARNIISFSLWGTQTRYLRGAVRNALLAPDIYPSWTCRFYVDDTVPGDVRRLLADLGAQVVCMPREEIPFLGLGWRFQVWDDAEVDFCLIRDCDSVISAFEAGAVNAWLASDAWFHVMRCWYTHTDLILAGLWGGATGSLTGVYDAYKHSIQNKLTTRIADQLFLREHVWPFIKHHALIHDRFFRVPGTTPFPHSELFPGGEWHVGINETAGLPQRQELALREYYRCAPSLQRTRKANVTITVMPPDS